MAMVGSGSGSSSSSSSVSRQSSPLGTSGGSSRFMATGSRGSRGHGWFLKYKEGLGGRHLQGRYWDLPTLEDRQAWNDQVFGLQQQQDQQNKIVLDVSMEGQITSLTMELATTALPLVTENVIRLVEDNAYVSTKIHRIEKNVGLFLGDVLHQNGKGGHCHSSLLHTTLSSDDTTATTTTTTPVGVGRLSIPNEPLVLTHIPGVVTMLCPSVHEVDSRFLICTHDAPQLDGYHVAFGRLDKASLEIVQQWATTVFTKRGQPTVDMTIVNCYYRPTPTTTTTHDPKQQQHGNDDHENTTADSVSSSTTAA